MSADRDDGADRTEPFLARWSRRKRAEAEPTPTLPATDLDDQAPDIGHRDQMATERVRRPISSEDGSRRSGPEESGVALPRLEDVTASSSVAAFLRKEVPEALKREALRKAWSLDPAIRDFVEVAENQYDWNVPGGVPGYGDLDPGADLGQLLDQALGVLEERPADPSIEAKSEDAETVLGNLDDEPATSTRKSVLADTPFIEVSAAEGGEKNEMKKIPKDSESTNVSGRRRHGGALPQ